MNFFRFLKSKSFFIQIGIAIVSVSLLIMGIKWWLSFTTNHDQKIQVPDLNKMSLSNVETKLKELNLDFLVIDSASYNPKYPKRSVIEQTPESGSFVKEKRKVYLTLNPSKYRDIIQKKMNDEFPNIQIEGVFSPPFKSEFTDRDNRLMLEKIIGLEIYLHFVFFIQYALSKVC